MSWQDRTPEERRDLRERRQKRRERKVVNQAANRSAHLRKVRGPADEASVAWDQVRLRINRITNGVERDTEWSRLARVLTDFNRDPASSSHAHSHRVGGS